MERDGTIEVPLTLRQVVALQLLSATGQNEDPEAIADVAAKLEVALESFRKAMGTQRFAAHLKHGWRRGARAPEGAE